MNGIVKSAIALFTLVGIIFSAYFYIDSTYAKGEELHLVALRLDQKIQQDRAQAVQERLWRLEDRYGTCDCEKLTDRTAKERCRELKKELIQLEKEKMR